MKWYAILALALAIVVRFAWHSKTDLAFHVGHRLYRGYPLNLVVFWLLIIASLSLASIAFLKRS